MLNIFNNQEVAARSAVLKSLPPGGVGVEIGVWKGEFSTRILKTAKPKLLHLVDPWLVSAREDNNLEAWYGANAISQSEMDRIHDGVASAFANEIAAGRVQIHRDASKDALSAFADNSVDFVYVDGDHSYEGVVADLEAALRVTRARGLIVCDDYMLGKWWKDGVVRAVHEFLVSAPVIIHSKQNSQIVMRKLTAS